MTTADHSDIARLCRGRVIFADLIDSAGRRKEPHYAILIDSDQQIDEIRKQIEELKSQIHDFHAVPVSSNNTIAPEWNLPAPGRAGLKKGFTQCHAAKFYSLSSIKTVTSMKVGEPEIDEIDDKVQEYAFSLIAKKKKK